MFRMLRIVLIGTGGIALKNGQALLDTGRAQIAGLYNRTPERAQMLARELHISAPVFADYLDMLDTLRPDAALICSPHSLHRAHFLACAERGIDILIEKPLALSTFEGEEMIAAADKNRIRAFVCHTQRYIPQICGLLDAMKDENLGALIHADDVIDLDYFKPERAKWCYDAAVSGGGMLVMHGAHQLDRLSLFLGGAPEFLAARVDWGSGYPGIDRGYAAFGKRENVSFSVRCDGSRTPHESGLTLYFERGTLRAQLFESLAQKPFIYKGDQNGWRVLPLPFEDGESVFYRSQFESMLDALEGKPSRAPTLREATDVLRGIEKIRALDAIARFGGNDA